MGGNAIVADEDGNLPPGVLVAERCRPPRRSSSLINKIETRNAQRRDRGNGTEFDTLQMNRFGFFSSFFKRFFAMTLSVCECVCVCVCVCVWMGPAVARTNHLMATIDQLTFMRYGHCDTLNKDVTLSPAPNLTLKIGKENGGNRVGTRNPRWTPFFRAIQPTTLYRYAYGNPCWTRLPKIVHQFVSRQDKRLVI